MKTIRWGVWDDGEGAVHVAPLGIRHRKENDGECWCGPKNLTEPGYARSLFSHRLIPHQWFDSGMLNGVLSCRICGFVQSKKNADDPCKGGAKVGPR